MSSICQSFESNAWRSDLCSHCFQSREEHERQAKSEDINEASTSGLGTRYQSVLNHCRSSYKSIPATPPPPAGLGSSDAVRKECEAKAATGILKSPAKASSKSAKCVNFPGDDGDAQVIGYGGHECLESDSEDDADHSQRSSDDEDDWPFTEEERVVINRFFFFKIMTKSKQVGLLS